MLNICSVLFNPERKVQGRRWTLSLTAPQPTWVLLSGGVDSASCVGFLAALGTPLRTLFVDYGQLAAERELAASSSVARHYRVQHDYVMCMRASQKPAGLIPGRNAFLLFAALLEGGTTPRSIALGIHAGTPYFDCTLGFVERMQALFDSYADGAVRILTPFLQWTKPDIWQYALEHDIPLHLTYSCERGQEQACGLCSSCRDLESLRAR
jgi:7-cyano-7-deazaguanine synthase